MTCSKPINYKQLIDTTRNTSELTRFLHSNNDNQELLSARIGITASSAGAQCESRLRSVDIGNFNIPVSLKHDGPTGQTTGQRGSDPSALLQAN